MTGPRLAPAIAVVGPANSGKTTLLHLLDRALQENPDRPLVYVVKGNPDGTGRYLYEAPALRERMKPRVKGRWGPGTVENICRWIDHCRASLELVVVDFGGRHSPENDRMLSRCSHFLVLAPEGGGTSAEAGDMDSWVEVCRRNGLQAVARICSLWQRGDPRVEQDAGGVLDAAFRSDASAPGDDTNAAVVAALAEELLKLRCRRPTPAYVDLRMRERWRVEDLADLGGLAPVLEERVRSGGPLLLGGRAPVWAYAAALHRALDLEPDGLVLLFDPKLAWNLVAIPIGLASEEESELGRCLAVRWNRRPGRPGATLDIRITTEDRFLPLPSALDLARAPLPEGPPPAGPLVVYGALPIWLHLAYSRWLRAEYPDRPLGHWDASTGRAVFVYGPRAPAAEPWEV
jgi:hypothetical protein